MSDLPPYRGIAPRRPDPVLGGWRPSTAPPAFASQDIAHILQYVRHPIHVVREEATAQLGLAMGGELVGADGSDVSLVGTLPPIYPEWLGDREFCEAHGIRFPYVTGAMANQHRDTGAGGGDGRGRHAGLLRRGRPLVHRR